MKASHTIITYILLWLLLGCSEPTTIPKAKIPKLVWQTFLASTGELTSSMNPVVGENIVIFSVTKGLDFQSPLKGYDKNTGEEKWFWTDIHPDSRAVGPLNFQYSYNGVLGYSTRGPVFGVEIESGNVLWTNTDYVDGRRENKGFSNVLINGFEEPQPGKEHKIHLGIADIEKGDWKIAVSLLGTEIWRPDITDFTGQVLPGGDTVLYLTGTWYRPDSIIATGFLKGWNITADTMLFDFENIESAGYLQLHEDFLLDGGFSLRCYDRQTGVLRWQRNIPNGVGTSGVVITGDKVLVNDGDNFAQKLHLFDIETGSRIWQSEVIETYSRLVVHKGVIYATGDRELKAINLEDGKLLWSIPSPHAKTISGAFFAPVVAIDPKTDRLFTSDYVYAMCYQLE
ncbi:MAG: PQQ-binding-like beta-propeller repeat protein [Bacteroidia bacterium]